MNRIIKTTDELFDDIYDEDEPEKMEELEIKLHELFQDGLISRSILEEDYPVFFSNKKLKRYEINKMADDIKKKILFYLLENHNVLFVIKNTQQGKMGIIINDALLPASKNKEYKIVPYIFADNNKSLADQLSDAIELRFNELKIPHRIFLLSSNERINFEFAMCYLDLYVGEKVKPGAKPAYPMPIYICLANPNQCEKILKLMNQVHKKVINEESILRNLPIWDEADKTYPSLRDKPFLIDEEMISCKTLMVDNTEALQDLWFVSATDGQLIDSELLDWQYPECTNAQIHHSLISPENNEKYRALHHPEAVTHRNPYTSHTNNSYATKVITNNKEHFMNPITLPTGEKYFRKIILNSNNRTKDMYSFAQEAVEMGMYALVFNGLEGASIKIYGVGKNVILVKTSKIRLNERLYYIYKKYNLNDKPLILLGRKKVDRGLGFHYCPTDNSEKKFDGPRGPLITSNKDGLVWSDMILGHIKDKNSAVQKAGRIAGNIGDSPQYPGNIHYWTDKETEQLIREHNKTVDLANTMKDISIGEALTLAKERVKEESTCKSDVDVPKKGSNPIITFDITDEDCEQFNGFGINYSQRNEFMMNKLKIYNFQEYQKYSDYKPHVWKMNTQQKIDRWGMDKMLKDGAVSTTTNIDDHTKNYIMFYIHENKIIINAWSGERMKD